MLVFIENGSRRGGVIGAPFSFEGGFGCQVAIPGRYYEAASLFSGIDDQLGSQSAEIFSKALQGPDELIRCH